MVVTVSESYWCRRDIRAWPATQLEEIRDAASLHKCGGARLMAPRGFDRYMVRLGMGTHPKFARLTDGEFRAHVVGVLAIAAASPDRGCLLVGSLPAEAVDVARTAGVPKRVAASALRKLEAVGVLFRDAERSCLRVHDWEEVNPPPGLSTERSRRFRQRKRNGDATPNATPSVAKALHEALPEVEVEVELPASTTSQQAARKRATRQVNQQEPPEGTDPEAQARIEAVLPVLHGIWELRGGMEPMPRGVGLAVRRNPKADHVLVAKKLEHWLLAGTGQRASCRDVTARFGDWVQDEGAAQRVVSGAGKESPSDIWNAMSGGKAA